MRKTCTGVMVLLALSAAPAARADETADKTAAARRLLAVAFPADIYQKIINSVSAQIPAEGREDVLKIMPAYQEMAAFEIGLYVKYFTAKELSELAKFYESPLGAKMLKILPEITADAQGFMMSRLQTEMPKLIEKWKKQRAAAPASDDVKKE